MATEEYVEAAVELISAQSLEMSPSCMSSGGGWSGGVVGGGGSGSGSGGDAASSLPSMSTAIYRNFALYEDPGDGSLNNSAAKTACDYIEDYWDAISEQYSSESKEVQSWIFFRSLGSIVYESQEKLLPECEQLGLLGECFDSCWDVVAGSFAEFDVFCETFLGFDSEKQEEIIEAVAGGHERVSSNGLDFAHFCITAAAYLAVHLNYCVADEIAAALINQLTVKGLGSLTAKALVKSLSGWLGDALSTIIFEDGMSRTDADSDMDAAIAAEGYIYGGQNDAKSFFRNYYYAEEKPTESERVSSFMSSIGIVEHAILVLYCDVFLCLYGLGIGIDLLGSLVSDEEKLSYIKDHCEGVYENFISRIFDV